MGANRQVNRGRKDRRGRRVGVCSAFSLLELLVVLAVTVILTALLFPAFRGVRENAQRLTCASNQRQIGAAIVLYATEHNDRLPPTQFASGPSCRPQEMMACTVGTFLGSSQPGVAGPWDGLGWLVSPLSGMYLDSPACLYCPSHHGDHPAERYLGGFDAPSVTAPIYANYHYVGDRTLSVESAAPRMLQNSHAEVLTTDGMRTKSDYNHINGANVLHGDCAIRWYEDVGGKVLDALPDGELPAGALQAEKYLAIWNEIITSEQPAAVTK